MYNKHSRIDLHAVWRSKIVSETKTTGVTLMSRSIHADVKSRVKTVTFPTADNFMDVMRAVGSMPIAKLHILYEEVYGEKPELLGENEQIVLSPNRKQMVRLCQYGLQSAFYGANIPQEVKGATEAAIAEELTLESPKAERASRGPTIKSLVLALLAGTVGKYKDPATGEEKEGAIVVEDKEIYAAVLKDFPDSKFDRTHLAWYLTQYKKGRFEKDGYGGTTGKPMGIRNLAKAAEKATRDAEKAAKEAERAQKALERNKKVVVDPTIVAPGAAAPAANAGDPLAEFGTPPAVTDPAVP